MDQSQKDGTRVVVIDDAQEGADALAEVLRIQGYEVQTAYGGSEGLDVIASFKPHCVLFDIRMPGIDGLELARRLRACYQDDVVLLAMTGLDPDEARVADTFSVVDHYFGKPLDLDALRKVLGAP